MKNYMRGGANTIARLSFIFLLGLACLIPLYFSSCSDSLDEREPQLQYGALEIASGDERALEIDKIKYAEVCVTGTGIESPIRSKETVSGGKGNIAISNIPVGKNRIVTVYAKDSSSATIYGVTLRTVVDIKAGETAKVSVNWTTTALGNVFNELNTLGVDLQAVDLSKISNCIDSSKHALLIDAAKIASDYKSNSLKTAADYVMTPATAQVNFTQAEGTFTVQVCDPISKVMTGVNGVTKVTNVAPGTWDVVLLNASGSEIKRKTLNTFTSGGTVTIDMDDKVWTDIVVHAKATYVWYWPTGVDGKCAKMEEETGGWYGYIFKDVSALNMIFGNSDFGKNDWSGKISDDVPINKPGEYWYLNGELYESNPEKPVTPSVKADVKSGTYLESQVVKLSSTNGSLDVIYYTVDGSVPTAVSTVYKDSIKIEKTCTLKARAYCDAADNKWGEILEISYIINPNADLEPPVIVPNKNPGKYTEAINVSFTFTDNKGVAGVSAYYTKDGSTPTTSSAKYTSGTVIPVAKDAKITIRILAVDAAGNKTTGTYYYYVGENVQATRWDPRQESIYFLLTARWFDGDPDNTIGDQWCSSAEDPSWRGDFKGLVEKMDYIKALGFTCIWITPIVQNRGPLCYHGYHAWDMYKEDARLVSSGYDFQRVVDEAHKRGMKICLDVVLQHSGRFGLKDFAEIKYNRDQKSYPVPVGWENFSYDEVAYEKAYLVSDKTGVSSVQKFPNGWEYDGLKSPGKYPQGWKIDGVDVGGQDIPPSEDVVGDVRPFTAADISAYPYLIERKNAAGVSPFQWPTTESYQLTIDTGDFSTVNGNKTANYTYEQYVGSPGLHFHGWANGFNDSGMFDKYPDANLRSIHEDCPDLNTESKAVQDYVIGAYKRYIDMGVDMFRVDTVMHIDKKTLNDHFWPAFFEEAETPTAKEARGGGDFFVFGEVANFINNLMNDKPAPIRQCNYTWDETVCPESTNLSNNHALNGNSYRNTDYTHKAVPESDYHVSTIDIVSHNGFCNGYAGAYNNATCDGAYNDATYLTWYTDSHDYGPNKAQTRWDGSEDDFAAAWSMLFTYRGIPIVYYGSEIKFAAGKPNDWPGSTKNTLNETGRAYYGEHLAGTVTATDFGEYNASGAVSTTLSSPLSKHLRDLNRMRIAIPALQMGQYSKDGHTGGWAGYKRRYTGKNKITGESVDSYVLVGVGAGTHSWTGALDGTYIDAVTGKTATCSGGKISFSVGGDAGAGLGVYVLQGLATPAPGKVAKESPYLGF